MRSIWLATMASGVLAGLSLLQAPCAMAAPAAAATPQAASSDNPGNPIELEAVVVQARRVNELQQQTPVAVTALSAERLRQDTIVAVQDLQRVAPSFEVGSTGLGGSAAPGITVRGLTGAILTDPAVVAYFDEAVTDSRDFAYSLYDLGSVQVLKGPQGTLFGKNSTGGALLLAPQRPTANFGGYIDARYGSYNDRELQGAINIPVNDQLQLRLAADYEKRDGTLESVTGGPRYDDRNHGSVRFEAEWRPTDLFENYFQFTDYVVRQINDLPQLRSLNTDCAAAPTDLLGELSAKPYCAFEPPLTKAFHTGDLTQYFAQQQKLGLDKTVANGAAPFDVDYVSGTDIASIKLGDITLKNILHADLSRYHIGFDFDGTPASLLSQDDEQRNGFFSDEFQFVGTAFSKQLSWIVGGYYSDLELNEGDVFEEVNFPLNPINPLHVRQYEPQKSEAAFGQATYDFSQYVRGLSLTAGYRYTWDQRSFTQVRLEGPTEAICGLGTSTPSGFIPFPGTDAATCTERLSEKFSDDNYNLSLNWQATHDLLVYVATRKGYKAGGFNFTASESQFITYAPEELHDVEAGLKADWRIGAIPLRTNVAVFGAHYDNIQSQVTRVDPVSGNLESLIVNQDPGTGTPNKATLYGGELELTAMPTRNLRLTAFYGYTYGVYDQFIFAGSPLSLNLKGQPIDGIAPHTAGVGVTYTPEVPDDWGRPELSANLYYRAQQTTNASDLALPPGAFTTLDLRVDWRQVAGRPIDIAIYGNNVTNARYLDLGLDLRSEVGILATQYSEPGSYGLQLRYHFGAGG
jgi:iron complex outermembrane receptor protein